MGTTSKKPQRVYQYLQAKFALEDVEKRHIKVSRINDLNDPFELLAHELPSKKFRQYFIKTKNELHNSIGLICLSGSWQNPTMWSHYADRHRGICLGFDVSVEIMPISYELERLQISESEFVHHDTAVQEEAMRKCLNTKFEHWKYEKEKRIYIALDADERHQTHQFFKFNSDFALKEIIVGPNCDVSRSAVARAVQIGEYQEQPDVFKSRLAFKTFQVVR